MSLKICYVGPRLLCLMPFADLQGSTHHRAVKSTSLLTERGLISRLLAIHLVNRAPTLLKCQGKLLLILASLTPKTPTVLIIMLIKAGTPRNALQCQSKTKCLSRLLLRLTRTKASSSHFAPT